MKLKQKTVVVTNKGRFNTEGNLAVNTAVSNQKQLD